MARELRSSKISIPKIVSSEANYSLFTSLHSGGTRGKWQVLHSDNEIPSLMKTVHILTSFYQSSITTTALELSVDILPDHKPMAALLGSIQRDHSSALHRQAGPKSTWICNKVTVTCLLSQISGTPKLSSFPSKLA